LLRMARCTVRAPNLIRCPEPLQRGHLPNRRLLLPRLVLSPRHHRQGANGHSHSRISQTTASTARVIATAAALTCWPVAVAAMEGPTGAASRYPGTRRLEPLPATGQVRSGGRVALVAARTSPRRSGPVAAPLPGSGPVIAWPPSRRPRRGSL